MAFQYALYSNQSKWKLQIKVEILGFQVVISAVYTTIDTFMGFDLIFQINLKSVGNAIFLWLNVNLQIPYEQKYWRWF